MSYLAQYSSLFFLSEYWSHIFFLRGQPMCVRDTRLQREHWTKLIQVLAQVPLASPLAFVLSPASHENKYTICPDPRKIQLSYTIQRLDLFIFSQWRLQVLSYWFGALRNIHWQGLVGHLNPSFSKLRQEDLDASQHGLHSSFKARLDPWWTLVSKKIKPKKFFHAVHYILFWIADFLLLSIVNIQVFKLILYSIQISFL